MKQRHKSSHRQYALGILALLWLFCFRVFAQFIQVVYPNDLLPPFEAWHSETLPYTLLFLSQIGIIVMVGNGVKKIWRREMIQNKKQGKIFRILGWIYFGFMGFRLLAGLTFADDHPWLGAKIPAFFHLVLAAILILFAQFHLSGHQNPINRLNIKKGVR